MIYVYEKQAWEYRVVVKNAGAEELLSEEEVNALGQAQPGRPGQTRLETRRSIGLSRSDDLPRPGAA